MSLPNRISLVSEDGFYLSSTNAPSLRFYKTTVGDDERFLLTDLGGGNVSLRDQYGRYVVDQGWALVLDYENTTDPKVFTLLDQGVGLIAIRGATGGYLGSPGGNPSCNSSVAGNPFTSFGLIDQTAPATSAPVDPAGTPLIAACTLNGAAQLLLYNPTNGYVYRSPIGDNSVGDSVLMNRSQPCELGCSSITVASHDGAMYFITYRKTDGKVAAYPLDLDGFGRAVIHPPYLATDAVQIGTPIINGVSSFVLFYEDRMRFARFTPGRSGSALPHPIQGELDLRPGCRWSVAVAALDWRAVHYNPSTGEVHLIDDENPSHYRLRGIVDRTFSQLASIVAEDKTGRVLFLRAGTTELTQYRITQTGLAQKEVFSLPTLRPPTLRLHAVDSGQLVSVGPDHLVKLCPDTQLDHKSQLEILPDPSGSFRLRTSGNRLLCVDGNGAFATCPDSTRDGTSLFRMVPQPGARFCLRTSTGRHAWVDELALKTGIDSELQQQGLFLQSLFEWNDYGVGGGDSYVDNVLGQPVTPAVFPDLVPVHSEYSAQANCYSFSTRSANSARADGFEQGETIFLAHSSRIGGTVPVYLEQKVKGHPGHHLSIRDAAKAAQWGYRQLGIAFYAYATQQPGTVAIYRESKSSTSGTQYYFSTRSVSEAAAQGFRREGVAFYAHAPLIPVNSSRGSALHSFYFSLPGAPVPAGFAAYDTVFCAHSVQALGTVPIYLEQQLRGERAYHLSTRDAAAAAQWGYKQLGVAFYAHATQQPGTVPVYRERPAGASKSQYYFSTRSAEEAAAAGAQQLGIAFYAYLPGAYLVARTQLIDTALGNDQQAKPTYRIVLDCRSITGQPIQSALTLSATASVTLKLEDGSEITIGPTRPITRCTSADGQLCLLLDPGQRLVVPVIKVKADFMSGTHALAIAPDQNAHRALSRLDSEMLQPLLGSRTALVKQVMGVLADSAPIAVAPTASSPVAFGLFDDVLSKVGNFFTHTIPSAAQDGARAVSQVTQPVVQAIQQSVPALVSGVNQAIAPGGAVMVSLQGASSQVQAVVSRGAVAAGAIAQQLQTGANVVLSFTTAVIHEAGSLGERAFNAFLIDTGAAGKLLIASAQEAAQLVVKLVEQVGKALSDLLLLVTSRFSWGNILVTHNGINRLLVHALHKMELEADKELVRGRDAIVGQIHGLGAQIDAAFDGFLESLPTPLIKGPLPTVDSTIEYFQSFLKKGMGQSGLPATLPTAPTDTGFSTGLASLQASLTPPQDSSQLNLPSDPMALLNEGPRLFFQAARTLINGALNGLTELLGSAFDSLSTLIHSAITFVRQLLNTELSIPVITPLYEQGIMKGNGTKLTLSSLISLFAAMILEGSHQVAAGVQRPFFPPAIADQFSGGQALAFSGADESIEIRRVIPATCAAIRSCLALFQGWNLLWYKGPKALWSNIRSLVFYTLSLVAESVGAWLEVIWGIEAGPAAGLNVPKWIIGLLFIPIGMHKVDSEDYSFLHGFFEILAGILKMILWGLKDQGASEQKRISNALDGVSNVLQTIGGGARIRMARLGTDPQGVAVAKKAAAIEFIRGAILIGLMKHEENRLALTPANAIPD